MKNTFSLQQISKTSNLDAILISPQYKINLMADFMRVKYENPKLKQSEIANKIGLISSTLQRYRNDINMLSPYRIHPKNTNKQRKKTSTSNSNNNLHRDPDLGRPQMTTNDLKRPQMTSKVKLKNISKGGANIEIKEHYLNRILDINDI